MAKKVQIKNDNEILNNIFHLISVKGVRQKDLADHLGLSKTAITQWKTNKSTSYMNYIDELASFFDVSKEEILHPNKTFLHDTLLSSDEIEIIHLFRNVKKMEHQKLLISLITTLVNCFNFEQA